MASAENGENAGPICKSGAKILYAWAMDAPALKLEEGVAFKVGKNTGINSLVLQIHYKNVESFIGPGEKLLGLCDSSNFDVFTCFFDADAESDSSGVTLETTSTP